MNGRLKAFLGVSLALGVLGFSLYLPAVRPLQVKGISEGPSEHSGMREGASGDAGGVRLEPPKGLAGLPMMGEPLTGDEAKAQISQLHGTGIEIVDGFMAMYGDGQRQAALWVSTSASEDDAVRLFDLMDARMPASTAFKNHALRTVAGETYHFVQGQGMDNYYWLQATMVVWLGLSNVDNAGQEQTLLATRAAL